MADKRASYYIEEGRFGSFVDAIIAKYRTVGPTAKRDKFDYATLESAEDLRLDFDVTILPPKKVFFPPVQQLLSFDGDEVASCIAPVPTVLLGVHFYDVKGIDIVDKLMTEPKCDGDYLAQRRETTIVASNIRNISEWAFWDTVGTEMKAEGMDAFLTKIDGGYVFDVYTDKGRDLVELGDFREAVFDETNAARQVNDSVMGKCEHRLHHSSEEIARVMRDEFDDVPIWKTLAEGCFSCGSCNLVCPTCFCFDVQDHWDLNQVDGDRTRYWDSCMACDFASTTLAGGGAENFRGERYERFRHRLMRKSTYLNSRVGGPACTGCGRCVGACTARIADPVKVINAVMEVER